MATSQATIVREISARIKSDAEIRREVKREADKIKKFLLRRTPGSTIENVGVHSMCKHDSPYATGALAKSIHLERRRERFGLPHYWLGSNHPNVNMIEYGTGPDDVAAGKIHGHWTDQDGEEHWHWNTPTPEFGMFAQTVAYYGGTMS